jgi:hypothetical protein
MNRHLALVERAIEAGPTEDQQESMSEMDAYLAGFDARNEAKPTCHLVWSREDGESVQHEGCWRDVFTRNNGISCSIEAPQGIDVLRGLLTL